MKATTSNRRLPKHKAQSSIPDVTKAHKRKRLEEKSDDEEIESESGRVPLNRQPYNSQILQPRETATTRATTKYRSRAKKHSPSPSHFSDTDFDAIPIAVPSSVSDPNLIPSTVADRSHRKSKAVAVSKHADTKPARKTGLPRARTSKEQEKIIKSKNATDDSIFFRRTKVRQSSPIPDTVSF
jgi:hypothetical protein